ncbi:MAG: PilW family protein [Kofleriaceae bacterium]|nr:PilW family protein [Myxococcales bacterium]MCB9562611.1 PilW family protein [Kofleriaceae bacterium]MCB9574544.1 PilW family protein [Kofleriaceae bacterium]
MTHPRAAARRRHADRGQRGLTIVELLVSMALVAILVGIALQIAVVVLHGYSQHRQGVAAQRSARSALDLISDAVRNASAGVPTGNITDAAGCTPFNAIDVVDSTTGPDELSVVTAAGGVVTSARALFTDGSTTMTVLDGSGFTAGDLVLISDFDKGHVVKITGVTQGPDDWTLDVAASTCGGLSFSYAPGALVLRTRIIRFYVADVSGVSTMMMDDDGDGPLAPEPLAEDVEDFQVAVGVDDDGDGAIFDDTSAADEWHYNAVGDTTPTTITTRPWRALRMTVVARSATEDVGGEISAAPDVEDHPGGSLDGFRRRLVSTIVEIRNLDGSP